MTRAELESKSLADLHALAVEQGVEGYRMLSKGELLDQLSGGSSGGASGSGQGSRGGSGRSRQRDRQRKKPDRERKPRQPRQRDSRGGDRGGQRRESRPEKPATPSPPAPPPSSEPVVAAPERPKRKRRRRRWGRRSKVIGLRDLLVPATGRQAIVYGETRQACTALLREVASDLSDASNGPDPIALLVDPTPEELAEWKRDAPQVEIVSAGQARHAGDAIAQATRRAEAGEDVIVLIDSLSRFAEAFKAANEAKELFDAGQEVGGSGTLTVVAALERSA